MGDLVEIPVITMYGPWAHWVREEWKTIETRLHNRFRSLEGRRIGIHVSQRWDDDAVEIARPYMTMEQRQKTNDLSRDTGHIICTAQVRLASSLYAKDSAAALIDCEHTQRFGLFLRDVRSLPICTMTKCAGKQGIWMAMLPRLWVFGADATRKGIDAPATAKEGEE